MLKVRHKGVSTLVMSLVSVAVMAVIAFGVSKMHELNFNGIHATAVRIQADQYAMDRANILRSMDYDSVMAMPIMMIAGSSFDGSDANAFFEEVVEESVSDDAYKEFKVNIYKGVGNRDVVSSVVVRHTNPGYLLDGQILGDDESSDKRSLSSSAAQDYAGGRFSEGMASDSETNAMSAAALKDYVHMLLEQYVLTENAVKHQPGKGAGSIKKPIYIANTGYVTAGDVEYRMNHNTTDTKIAVVVKEDDHYYIDYLAKSDFFKY